MGSGLSGGSVVRAPRETVRGQLRAYDDLPDDPETRAEFVATRLVETGPPQRVDSHPRTPLVITGAESRPQKSQRGRSHRTVGSHPHT